MKNKRLIIIGGVLAVIGFGVFGLAACERSSGGGNNDVVGTWEGTIRVSRTNYNITVEITKSRWSISGGPNGATDAGTYERDGNTGYLQSTVNNFEVGTATLVDKNTISLTLNQRTFAPGTHTLTRRCGEGDFEAKRIDDGKGAVITGYTGVGGNVSIPARIQGVPVISIGGGAFHQNQLTKVTIPNRVKTIGGRAFQFNQLTKVTIGNSVKTIEDYAFAINELTSVTIPNSVTHIGQGAFAINELTSVTIGANVMFGYNNSFGGGFEDAYNNNGKRAGRYTRPNTSSTTWTRK